MKPPREIFYYYLSIVKTVPGTVPGTEKTVFVLATGHWFTCLDNLHR